VVINAGSYSNVIGGTTVAERNVIAGNAGWGVRITGSGSDSNQVLGNYIGVDVSGNVALTNGDYGVRIENSAQHNQIGPNNIIAHFTSEGISNIGTNTDYNTFTQNSIYGNGSMNIAVGSGANEDIAPPAITSFTTNPVTISGTLSPVCTGCTIELFASLVSYPRAGRTYLGSTTTTGTGAWTITPTGLAGPYLTATVTDPAKGTSEFSSNFFRELKYIYLPLVLK